MAEPVPEGAAIDKWGRVGYDKPRWDSGCSRIGSAAEHRNGVRFPGEPVAVMGEERSILSLILRNWEGGARRLNPQPKDLPG